MSESNSAAEALSPIQPQAQPVMGDSSEPEGLCCDFCGDRVMRVRRVALDGDYERLQTRHAVRYACESCSEEKERQRLGMATATG